MVDEQRIKQEAIEKTCATIVQCPYCATIWVYDPFVKMKKVLKINYFKENT